MLTKDEIKQFLQEDATSTLKQKAREGQRYYEGEHDILDYRMFYYNADGNLVEDKYRSNVKIPHPFFTELVDQGTQFVLSGTDGIFKSDDTGLQKHLDTYFNKNKRFMVELSETITGMQAKGFDYMHAYVGKDDRLCFENADCLGVVEVEGRFAEDGKDQYIWQYLDRIDKDGKKQWKVLNIDDENTYYYIRTDNDDIEDDLNVKVNPKPHRVYRKDDSDALYVKSFGFLPFFRIDNNKKKHSLLKPVKAAIDDYDIMASSLSNNLIDFDTPIHVVKGFQGDNLDELQTNVKTKKMVGVDENGGMDIMTVDVPYQAREAKLKLDEQTIYKAGMGLNMAGLKDTAATTNIAIKAAYSLLELRCGKIIDRLELFLMDLLEPVLTEINEQNNTAYDVTMVWFNFVPEVMSNALENAQIDLTIAQRKQTEINTLLSLATQIDNETLMKGICDQLDIDYYEIKDKLPDPEEGEASLTGAVEDLEGAVVVE